MEVLHSLVTAWLPRIRFRVDLGGNGSPCAGAFVRCANHESRDRRSAVGNGRLVPGGQTIGGVQHANGASAREHPRRRAAGHHYPWPYTRGRPRLPYPLLLTGSSALFQRGIGVSVRGRNPLGGHGTPYFEKNFSRALSKVLPEYLHRVRKIMSLLPSCSTCSRPSCYAGVLFPGNAHSGTTFACSSFILGVGLLTARHPIVSSIRRYAYAVAFRG